MNFDLKSTDQIENWTYKSQSLIFKKVHFLSQYNLMLLTSPITSGACFSLSIVANIGKIVEPLFKGFLNIAFCAVHSNFDYQTGRQQILQSVTIIPYALLDATLFNAARVIHNIFGLTFFLSYFSLEMSFLYDKGSEATIFNEYKELFDNSKNRSIKLLAAQYLADATEKNIGTSGSLDLAIKYYAYIGHQNDLATIRRIGDHFLTKGELDYALSWFNLKLDDPYCAQGAKKTQIAISKFILKSNDHTQEEKCRAAVHLFKHYRSSHDENWMDYLKLAANLGDPECARINNDIAERNAKALREETEYRDRIDLLRRREENGKGEYVEPTVSHSSAHRTAPPVHATVPTYTASSAHPPSSSSPIPHELKRENYRAPQNLWRLQRRRDVRHGKIVTLPVYDYSLDQKITLCNRWGNLLRNGTSSFSTNRMIADEYFANARFFQAQKEKQMKENP